MVGLILNQSARRQAGSSLMTNQALRNNFIHQRSRLQQRSKNMGAGSWSATDWDAYASTTRSKHTSSIFKTTSGAKASLNPLGVVVRESRDSDVNPESTAIIVGLDVTGSMGMIADTLAREGLGVLFTEILDRKPVS